VVPFEVPDRFLAAVAAGAVRRVGATLRDSANGGIVAHLQETRLLQETVGGAAGPGGPGGLLLSAARLGSSAWANVQLGQVKSALDALGMLNAATLAAAAVGVGVSAAGFALVRQRLQAIDRSLGLVHRDVLAGRRAAERADPQLAAAHQAVVGGLLYRAEEAWERSDAQAVWRELEGRLDEAQRYCRGLVGGVGAASAFLDWRFTLEEAAAAYEAALALAAARVQALLLIEECAGALRCAREFHEWHERAVGGLLAVDVAASRSRQLADAAGLSEGDAHSRLLHEGLRLLEAVREARLHAASRVDLLRALAKRGASGREYVEAARDAAVPLLALPAE
jgi:hypothetical protein